MAKVLEMHDAKNKSAKALSLSSS